MTSRARKNRIIEAWFGLPETWRTHLMSGFITFISFSAISIGFSILDPGFTFSMATIGTLLGTAVRAGVRALMMPASAQVLPDPAKE